MIRSRSGGGGDKKASGRILEEELYSKRDVLRDGKTGVMVMPKWSGIKLVQTRLDMRKTRSICFSSSGGEDDMVDSDVFSELRKSTEDFPRGQ